MSRVFSSDVSLLPLSFFLALSCLPASLRQCWAGAFMDTFACSGHLPDVSALGVTSVTCFGRHWFWRMFCIPPGASEQPSGWCQSLLPLLSEGKLKLRKAQWLEMHAAPVTQMVPAELSAARTLPAAAVSWCFCSSALLGSVNCSRTSRGPRRLWQLCGCGST